MKRVVQTSLSLLMAFTLLVTSVGLDSFDTAFAAEVPMAVKEEDGMSLDVQASGQTNGNEDRSLEPEAVPDGQEAGSGDGSQSGGSGAGNEAGESGGSQADSGSSGIQDAGSGSSGKTNGDGNHEAAGTGGQSDDQATGTGGDAQTGGKSDDQPAGTGGNTQTGGDTQTGGQSDDQTAGTGGNAQTGGKSDDQTAGTGGDGQAGGKSDDQTAGTGGNAQTGGQSDDQTAGTGGNIQTGGQSDDQPAGTGEDGQSSGAEDKEPGTETGDENQSPGSADTIVALTGQERLVEAPASNDHPLLQENELRLSTMDLRGTRSGVDHSQDNPSENGHSIVNLTVNWMTHSAGSEVLVLDSDTANVEDQKFRIDFKLSSEDPFEAGSIELIIPAYIWVNRNGSETGTITLSVPEDPEMGADFAWRRVGDNIVFTNTHRMLGNSNGMIQGTYRTVKTADIVDVDVKPESEYYVEEREDLNGYSNEFYAIMNVEAADGTQLRRTSDPIKAAVNSRIDIESATKVANSSNLYWSVPSTMPAAFRPDDPDNYIYARWYLTAKTVGYQPFLLEFEENEESLDHDGILLGAEGLNAALNSGSTTKAAENGSVEGVLYKGHSNAVQAAYIWAAYPKSSLTATTELKNTATFRVKGLDDLEVRTKTAEGSVKTLVYTIKKVWDDGDNELGVRPSGVTIRASRRPRTSSNFTSWKDFVLNDSNSWQDGFLEPIDSGYSYKFEELNFSPMEGGETVTIDGYDYYKSWKYTKTASPDDDAKTYLFTNKLTKTFTPYQKYTVKKVWDDSENQYGHRPASVAIQVRRSGSLWKTCTLSEANNWEDSFWVNPYTTTGTFTFSEGTSHSGTGRDVWVDGKEYRENWNYTQTSARTTETVTKEVDSQSFDITDTITTFTNKLNRTLVPVTEYTLKKVWDDNQDEEGHRPNSVTITMSRNDVLRWKSFTLNQGNDWSAEWDDDGYPSTYKVLIESQYLARGSEEEEFTPDGMYRVVKSWWYSPSTSYNSQDHTFTQTNKYNTLVGMFPVDTLDKTAVNYTDYTFANNLRYGTNQAFVAPFDHYLDDLLHRDQSVEVQYSVSATTTTVTYNRDSYYNAEAYESRCILRDTDGVIKASGTDLVPGTDYEIAGVTGIGVIGHYFSRPDENKNWHIVDSAPHDYELWGETAAGSVLFAKKEGESLSGQNGATVSGNSVTLPEGVYRVWFEIPTRKDRLVMSCRMTVRLLPSDHLKELILESEDQNGYTMLGFENTASMTVFDRNGVQRVNGTNSDTDYLHGRIPHPKADAAVSKTGLTYLDSTQTNTKGSRTGSSSYRYDYTQDFLLDDLLHWRKTADLSYDVSGHVDITPYTKEEDADGRIMGSYEKRSATAVLNDGVVEANGTTLTPGSDYVIASVTLNRSTVTHFGRPYERSAQYSFLTSSSARTELWGETTAGETVRYACVEEDGTLTAENGATVSGSSVILPDGVRRVWESSETRLGRISMGYRVTIRLKPTETVKRLIEASENASGFTMLQVTNTSDITIVDDTDTSRESASGGASEYIHGRIPHPIESITGSKSSPDYSNSNVTATSDYTLTLLQRDKEVLLKYNINTNAYVMPDRLEEGQRATRLTSYTRPVTLMLAEERMLLDEAGLTAGEDYEMVSATIRQATSSIYRRTFTAATSRYDYMTPRAYPYKYVETTSEDTELWGQTTGGETLRFAYTENGTVHAENGAENNNGTITLPSGVVRIWEKLTTERDYISMGYTVTVRLKPTESVKALIDEEFEGKEYAMLPAINKVSTKVINSEEETVQESEIIGSAFLHGRDIHVGAGVSTVLDYLAAESDQIRGLEKLHVTDTVIMRSNTTDNGFYDEMFADIPNSNTGTWYDLLPPGMEADINSIKVSGGGTVNYAYTVPNYKDSGRTLVVVAATYPQERTAGSGALGPGYPASGIQNSHTLEFDGYYTWTEILSRDLNMATLTHTVAYEAEENAVGDLKNWAGEADDPRDGNNYLSGQLSDRDKDLMAGLDDDRTDPSFVYGQASTVFNPDLAMFAGIEKKVSADGVNWTKGHATGETGPGFSASDRAADVYEGGTYRYRLMVSAESSSEIHNLYVFDALEDYQLKEGEDDGMGRWKGSFMSLDLSELSGLDVAPVVYYYTGPAPDMSERPDLSQWTTTLPDDPSEVTAFAVDCTKDKDGKDFILHENQSIIIYVNMRAPLWPDMDLPEGLVLDEEENEHPHAFNNCHIDYIFYRNGQLEQDGYMLFDSPYTKIGILPYEISVAKTWVDDDDRDGLRTDSVTLRLFRNGEPTDTVVVLDESVDWEKNIIHLPKFDDNGRWINYTFVEDPVEGYETRILSSFASDSITYKVTNTHEPELIDVPFRKVWENDNNNEDGNRPESLTVRLLADGKFTGKTKTLYPDAGGAWADGVFEDLFKYRDGGEEIVYTVEEVPVYRYAVGYEAAEIDGQDGFIITNTYHPYGELVVEKQLTQGATEAAKDIDFTFSLTLYDSAGGYLQGEYYYEIYGADGELKESGMIGNGGEFTLKADERFIIPDKADDYTLPSETRYEVVEQQDHDAFTLSGSSLTEGVIVAGETQTANFINHYTAEGRATVSVKKDLQGRSQIARNQFRFQLSELDGTLRGNAYVNTLGEASFGALRFAETDVGREDLIYKITEFLPDPIPDGYTFSDQAFYVKVTVADPDGEGRLSTSVAYFMDEDCTEPLEGSDKPVFVNQYLADGNLRLRAWKSLPGRDLTAGEFTFELLDENEDPVLDEFGEPITAVNDEEGVIDFPEIYFLQDGEHDIVGVEHIYLIREHIPEETDEDYDETVTYDDTVYRITVTPMDNGDGTLSFNQTTIVEDEDETNDDEQATPVFRNTLRPGTLTVTKVTDGTGADPDKVFRFRIKFSGEDLPESLGFTMEEVDNDPEDMPGIIY